MKIIELNSKKKLWIISLLLILAGILTGCRRAEATPDIPPRSVVESNLELSEIWHISSLSIWWGAVAHQKPIVLTPHRIVAVANAHKDGGEIVSREEIISFDPSTGSLEWAVPYGGKTFVDSITADQNRVYLAAAGDPLRAYDLETGNLVWSGMRLMPDRTPHYLTFQNDTLLRYFGNSQITIFNPDTGEVLEEDPGSSAPGYFRIMRLNGFDLYASSFSKEILKVKRDSGEIMWRTNIPRTGIMNFPILSNNRLIMASGGVDVTIYGIDFTTGQFLWQADGVFVSNIAISQGKVYALRADARLLIFDQTTGIELGYVQFSPTQTIHSSHPAYWVGVDEQQRIFVYFSDSEELIALAPVQSDLTFPTPLASLQESTSTNMDSEIWVKMAFKVLGIKDPYLYLLTGPNLLILNISNPAQPTLVGQATHVGSGKIVDNMAYLLAGEGVVIADFAHPLNLTGRGSYRTPGPLYTLEIAGKPSETGPVMAYLTGNKGELYIVDVSQPDTPIQVGFYQAEEYIADIVAVTGEQTNASVNAAPTTAYLAVLSQGLHILDVSNPTSPTPLGFYHLPNILRLAVAGNIVYALDGDLHLIDVSNPYTPTEVGFYQIGELIKKIEVLEDVAYLLGNHRTYLIDISDPSAPVKIGTYEFPDTFMTTNIIVAPHDNPAGSLYAYVSTFDNGLRVIDVSNPGNPIEVGSYTTPFNTTVPSPSVLPTPTPTPFVPSSDRCICAFGYCICLSE